MVEDYELSQVVWHEQAVEEDKSFIVFSNPAEFEENISTIDKNANIYVDSNFPDTKVKGEDWAKSLFNSGFENIYLCSTKSINISGYSWIKGKADKNKPFKQINLGT